MPCALSAKGLVGPQEFTRFATEYGYDNVIVYDCQPNDDGVNGTDSDMFNRTYLGRLFDEFGDELMHDPGVCSWRVIGTTTGELDEGQLAARWYDSSSPYGLIVHFRTDGSVNRNGWDATFQPLLTTSLSGSWAYWGLTYPPSVSDAIRASGAYLSFNATVDSYKSFVDHRLPRDGRLTPYRTAMDAIWAIRFQAGGGQPNSIHFTRFDLAGAHLIVIGVSASNEDLDEACDDATQAVRCPALCVCACARTQREARGG